MSQQQPSLRDKLGQVFQEDLQEIGRIFLGEAAQTKVGREMIEQYKQETIAKVKESAEKVSLYVVGAGVCILGGWLLFRR